MKKIISLYISLLFFHDSMYAELLFVKKNNDGFALLSQEDSLKYGGRIADALLKYQWPMCLASDLTAKEKDELFSTDTMYAEELFIQRKLQDVDENLCTFFIPTALYELFEIIVFFESYARDIYASNGYANRLRMPRFGNVLLNPYFGRKEEPSLHKKEDPSNFVIKNDFEKTMLKFNTDTRSNLARLDQKLVSVLNNPITKELTPRFIQREFINTYAAINDVFYKQPIEKVEVPIIAFNTQLLHFLVSCVPDLLRQSSSMELAKKIDENSEKIIEKMIERFKKAYNAGFLHDFHRHTSSLNIWVISQAVAIEYEARKLNKALLFRGSQLISSPVGGGKVAKIIGTSLHIPQQAEDIEKATLENYKNLLTAYSVSLGSSLFAGFINNQGGCAYSYLTMKQLSVHDITGFVLFINKRGSIRT